MYRVAQGLKLWMGACPKAVTGLSAAIFLLPAAKRISAAIPRAGVVSTLSLLALLHSNNGETGVVLMKSEDSASESLQLIDAFASDKLAEISSEFLELGLDSLIDNEIIKEIPVFGTVAKLFSLFKRVQANSYARRIAYFLSELSDIPFSKRASFIKQLENEKKRKKAGETWLMILHRLDEDSKAKIFGKLLKASVDEKISYTTFLRLSYIVEKVFLEDLIALKECEFLLELDSDVIVNLANAGLLNQKIEDHSERAKYLSASVGRTQIIPPTFKYEINELGELLVEYGL